MENEFPPNSNTKKEVRVERRVETEPSEKKVIKQVTKGKVKLRKRPLHKQFFDTFKPEDNRGFFEHTLLEVVAPGIKNAFLDTTISALENTFGGGGGAYRGRSRGGYTSYSGMSKSRSRREDREERRSPSRRSEPSASFDLREIILDSRVEAEEVLDQMIELISKYDVATVRDLLGLIGEPHKFTDEDWGWTDLRGSRIHRIGRDGFLLDLPRPDSLD